MAFLKNIVDAAIIVFAFYFGSLGLEMIGIDFIQDSILSPFGAIVALLLAFMEVTYNRF